MITKRITNDMNVLEIICTLGENNPGSMTVIANMVNGDLRTWGKKVNTLDELNIYGNEIWTLFDNCCDGKPEIFNYALELLVEHFFPSEEFANNLVLNSPIKIFTENDIKKINQIGFAEFVKTLNKIRFASDFKNRYNDANLSEININTKPEPQPGDNV